MAYCKIEDAFQESIRFKNTEEPNPFTTYEYYENDLPHFTPYQTNNQFEKLEQKINEMSNKMDMVLSNITKLGNPRSEQENLHDIILFAVFGVFFIYILDQMRRKK